MKFPPYSLCKLLQPEAVVSRPRKIATVEEFFAFDEHCLSLFCRVLRRKCPTVSKILGSDGSSIIKPFNDTLLHKIDFAERSHNQFRTDIRSDGKSKSFTVSANRIICRQLKAESMRRGGDDPSKLHQQPVGKCKKQKTATPSGGNSYIEWRNVQVQVHKSLYSPSTPMDLDQQVALEIKLQQKWADLPQAEKDEWMNLHYASRMRRQIEANRAAREVELNDAEAMGPLRKQPVWEAATAGVDSVDDTSPQSRDPPPPIPVVKVINEHMRCTAKQRKALAYRDESLYVSEAPDRLAAYTAPLDGSSLVTGCFANKKNCCRVAMTPSVREDFDMLTSWLNGWVTSLGAAEARKAVALVLIEGKERDIGGDDDDGAFRAPRCLNAMFLLVNARFSPKVSYLCRCRFQAAAPEDASLWFDWAAMYPTTVSLATTMSKMASYFRCLFCHTSEELCLELARKKANWKFYNLNYKICHDYGKPLMDMHVTGIKAEIPQFRPRAPRVIAVPVVPDHLFERDPWETVKVRPPPEHDDGPDEPDADLIDLAENDVVNDVIEVIEEALDGFVIEPDDVFDPGNNADDEDPRLEDRHWPV